VRAVHNPSGEVCAITGGAYGIGWALTEALADAGVHVHVCDNSEAHLSAADKRRAALPAADRIDLTACDVSDSDALVRWIGKVLEYSGHLDLLVNNAAFVRWESFEHMSVEQCEQTFRVGYDAAVRATKLMLPAMRAHGHGHIVFIGSSTGRMFTDHASAAYAARCDQHWTEHR
jgi:NAD(P)-dependent dehydrogenase (short-subunit alcohol dehydrogenase family)